MNFIDEAEKPEAQFLTLAMEASFADLKASVIDYVDSRNGKIWRLEDGSNGVPPNGSVEVKSRRSDFGML